MNVGTGWIAEFRHPLGERVQAPKAAIQSFLLPGIASARVRKDSGIASAIACAALFFYGTTASNTRLQDS